MGKIYISGPVSGTDDYMQRFENAENTLKRAGFYDVVNPAKVCAPLNPKTTTWEQYMTVCMPMVNFSNAIYMLKGWKDSRGARREYHRARTLGLLVIYEDYEGDDNSDTADAMMDV